jgi:hypothetical protein
MQNCFVSALAAVRALAVVLVLFSVPAFAQTLTWTGGGDGTTFGQATNWSPAAIPGATNDLVIPAGAGTIVVDTQGLVRSITTARPMSLQRYLNVTAGMTLQGGATITTTGGYELRFEGPTSQSLSGTGTVTADASGGGIRALPNSNLTVGSGVTIRAASGSMAVRADLGSTLTLNTTVTTDAGRAVNITATGTINNTLTVEAVGANSRITISGTGTFNNSGTVRASGSSGFGSITMSPTSPGLGFVNTGILLVEGLNASFAMSGTWSNATGTLVAQNQGEIELGGTFTVPAMGNFTRTTGLISFNNAFLSGNMTPPDGLPWRVSGTTTLTGVTLPVGMTGLGYVDVVGTLSFQNNAEISTGGGYEVRAIGPGPVQFSGTGRISVQASSGGMRVRTGVTATVGSGVSIRAADGTFALAVEATGVLNSQATIAATNGRTLNMTVIGTLNNTGTIEATGTNSRIAVSGSGTLNNQNLVRVSGSNATMSILISSSGGAAGFVNTGSVLATGARSTMILGNTWTNTTGTLTTQSSAIFQLGGTFTIPGMGSFTRTTGTLNFNGATISGTMTPPDGQPWTYDGNVTLNNATLPVNLTGNSGYIDILGTLTLQNNSDITIDGGYEVRMSGPDPTAINGAGRILAGPSSGGVRVQNNAVATISSGVSLSTINGGAGFNVLAGSTLNFAGTASAVSNRTINASINGTLNNTGILEANGSNARISITGTGTLNNSNTIRSLAGGVVTISLTSVSPALGFVNTGTARASGTNSVLTLSNKWSNPSGTFVAETSGRFEVGGTFSVAQLGNFTRATGTLSFKSASLSGSLASPDGLPWNYSGDINLDNVTLPVSLIGNSGYVNVFNTLTLQNNADIAIDGGYEVVFSGVAPSLITGTGTISPGPGSGGVRTATGANGTMDTGITFRAINGSGTLNSQGTFNNKGTFTIGPNRSLSISIGAGRSIVNNGTIQIDGNSSSINFNASGTMTNAGTFAASGQFSTFLINSLTPLTNYNPATNTLSGGTWAVARGGTFSFIGSPSIRTLAPGTTVRLADATSTFPAIAQLTTNNGTLSLNTNILNVTPFGGTFTNNGTVNLERASRLAIAGAYTQSAAGLSKHAVAGTTTASNGRITATGAVSLGGAVQGTVVAPFDPGLTAYSVLSGVSRAGTFSTVSGDASKAAVASYTTTDAFLQFFDCPIYTLQPEDQFACPSGGAVFTTVVGGLQPISYQWKRNNINLADGPTAFGSVVSGSATPTLTITGVTPDDAGSYSLAATNTCGSATSNPATLGVRTCVYLCFADFDGSGGTPDVTDIDAFFTGWLGGDECADVDCSGGTPDVSDIDVFFNGWLAGGC